MRVALYRGETKVFESEVSAHTPAFGHNALDDTEAAAWTAGFTLGANERVYGLGETRAT